MSEHTKEPWKLCEVGDKCKHLCPASQDDTSILTVALEYDDDGEPTYFGAVYNPDDARRIVACVNACAGMGDPAEGVKQGRDLAKKSYEAACTFKAQRDELQKKLGKAVDIYSSHRGNCQELRRHLYHEWYEDAKSLCAAIANAEKDKL